MTHDEALEDNLPERYLLGDLRGSARETFEEHVFECTLCAADLADGAVFLGTSRQHFRNILNQEVSRPLAAGGSRRLPWVAWPLALASLLLLGLTGYQNLLQLPRLKSELARAESPATMRELVLAGEDARGAGGAPTVTLRRDQALLLAVDIQADARYTAYLCTLRSAAGVELWTVRVDAADVHDAVPIRVPARFLSVGLNSLHVQGVTTAGVDTAQTVAKYQFDLQYQP